MPTLRNAIALFDMKSKNEIPNRVTKIMGPLAGTRRDPILTNVRNALRHAVRGFPEHSRLNADDFLNVEIAPFLSTLPDHAELDANESGRTDPSKERSNVNLFVTVVTGRDVVRVKKPIETAQVLEAWRPLYAALKEYAERTPKKRTYPRMFVRFMDLAVANGVVRPEDVPDDYEAIHSWAPALKYSKRHMHEALCAFRAAAKQIGDPKLAGAYDLTFKDGIGIRGLPDYPSRGRAAGLTGDPLSWPLLDLVAAIAPAIGAALRVIVSSGRTNNRTPTYEDEILHCSSWLVASLIRLGEDPRCLTFLDLFVERRAVRVARSAEAESGRDVVLHQLAKHIGTDADGPEDVEEHCLLRRCLDITPPLSFRNSHLRLSNGSHANDASPVYTESLVANLKQTFLITKALFSVRLNKKCPDLWARVTNEYESLLKAVTDYNAPRLLVGRKAKKQLQVTWPQAVCMGLPYLRTKALTARRAVIENLQRKGYLESRESRKSLHQYYTNLRDYVVVAVLLDDSLRVTNYSGAMARVHFRPTPLLAHGQWCGFSGCRTNFRGDDEFNVRLKILRSGDRGINDRDRPLTPGIVDMSLLFEWWTKARPHYLVQAGLLKNPAAFGLENENFPVFPTGRPDPAQRANPAWKGNLSADSLSQIFGRAIHEVCVRVLGQTQLPAWGDPALTEEHRSLFAGHIVRLLTGTYFGGIRGDWSTAEYLTNDCEATLRRHYVGLSAYFRERMHKASPENPRWFDAVIALMLEARDGDDWARFWDRFDPWHPAQCVALLDQSEIKAKGRQAKTCARRSA